MYGGGNDAVGRRWNGNGGGGNVYGSSNSSSNNGHASGGGGGGNGGFDELDGDDGIDWSSVPLDLPSPSATASTGAASMQPSSLMYTNQSSVNNTSTGSTTTATIAHNHNKSRQNSMVNNYSTASHYDVALPSSQNHHPQPQPQKQGYQQQNYHNYSSTLQQSQSPPPQNMYQRNNIHSSSSSSFNNAATSAVGGTTTTSAMTATATSMAGTNNLASKTATTNNTAVTSLPVTTAVDSSEADALRKQIEALTKQLRQKDEELFELGTTLASVEVEANHRAENAEKKTRLAEEQLHRVQMEADAAHASLARQRKRAAAAANAAAAAVANAAAMANGVVVNGGAVGRSGVDDGVVVSGGGGLASSSSSSSSSSTAVVSPNRVAVSVGQNNDRMGQKEGAALDREGRKRIIAEREAPTAAAPESQQHTHQNENNKKTSSSSSSIAATTNKDSVRGRVVTPLAGEARPAPNTTKTVATSIEERQSKSVSNGNKKQKLDSDSQASTIKTAHATKLPIHVWDDKWKASYGASKADSGSSIARHLLLKDGLWSSSSSSPLLSGVLECLENSASSSPPPPPESLNKKFTDEGNSGNDNDIASQFFSFPQKWLHSSEEITEINEDEIAVRTILTRMAFDNRDLDSKSIDNKCMEGSAKPLDVEFLVRELIVMIVGKFRQYETQRHGANVTMPTNPTEETSCNNKGNKEKTMETNGNEKVTSEKLPAMEQCATDFVTVPRSWMAVLKLLRILREVILLSSKARECTRAWLSSSHSSNESISESRSSPVLGLSPFSLSSASQRICGVDADAFNTRASMLFPCLAATNSTRGQMSWERQNRRETCSSFIDILAKLSLGHYMLGCGTEKCVSGGKIGGKGYPLIFASPMHIIERMVQREGFLFILSYTCDAPVGSNQEYDIWGLWYDVLLSSETLSKNSNGDNASTSNMVTGEVTVSGSVGLRGNLVSILECDVDRRRHVCFEPDRDTISPADDDATARKRGRGQQRSRKRGRTSSNVLGKRSDSQERSASCNDANLGDINDGLKLEIKCLTLRLISRLLTMSTSVRRRFFQTVDRDAPYPDNGATTRHLKNASLGGRALAAVLDELEGHILPRLCKAFPTKRAYIPSSGLAGSKNSNSPPDSNLLLCLSMMRFMACLCQSQEGAILLRTQMRIVGDSDAPPQWSASGVAVATSTLDCVVAALYRHRDDAMPRHIGSLGPLWGIALRETVSFFRVLLYSIQLQRQNSERYSKEDKVSAAVPFLAIISERKNVFYSCLHLIFYCGSSGLHGSEVDDSTISNVRMLLDELSLDEEEEEEMKQG